VEIQNQKESSNLLKTDDLVVALPSSHLAANLGGEFVVLNLADEIYYGLSGVGGRIWELVQEPRTVGHIVETIAREYDVDPTVCAEDTETFLSELSRRSFVEIVPADQ
jgi:hypothetical protein